jgi:hypothetical protein
MARYFLNPTCSLDWLLEQDSQPDILPVFPADDAFSLVVAYLASGQVIAEVIPAPQMFETICGSGMPLGRLYFHICKNRLYNVCRDLTPESFSGGDSTT